VVRRRSVPRAACTRNCEATLRDAAQRAGFALIGEPIYARYNAPFVPWFLRRNEVLFEVRE
jgi:hypothetical protein